MKQLQILSLFLVLSFGTACEDLGVFWAEGVQQDLDPAVLSGWTECFRESYATAGTSVDDILAACPGEDLLMACRPASSETLTLAAMASREAVTAECDGSPTCTFAENGVGWYFYPQNSWGFAPDGQIVNLDSCDFDGTEERPAGESTAEPLPNPELRLCWHMGESDAVDELDDGYRCGQVNLNGNADWERLIYTTGEAGPAVPSPDI